MYDRETAAVTAIVWAPKRITQLQFFEGVPESDLSDELSVSLFDCGLQGRVHFDPYKLGHWDVELDCDNEPCLCAVQLKRWRAGWVRLPRLIV